MEKNTVMWIVGLGAAYYFLSTRVPQYTLQLNGTYLPSTFIDQLTVMLTGAVPPAPVPQGTAATIASTINQITPAIQQIISATN
jgi:hypothetical protein